MWSVQPEDRGPLRRVVAADPLEDAGAVVEAVRADVDARVVPVDELAVHPDLLGGLHARLLRRDVGELYRRATRSAVRAPASRCEVGRARSRAMCARRAGADPDDAVLEQRPLDQRLRDRALRERRDRARLEAVASTHLRRPSRPAPSARRPRRATFALVGAAVARDEREHVRAVADEDERLDDLRELAADRARRVARGRRALGELLDPRVDRRRAQDAGDALDRLGGQSSTALRIRSRTRRPMPFAAAARRARAGTGESIESAISALPPSRFRETAMFAMLTPASPNSVPTRPITPGTSS